MDIIPIIHVILFIILENNKGFAMAQEVSRLSLTAKERIRSQDNLCRICVTQSVTATDSHFSRRPSVFPVCHSTHLTDIAAYSTDTNRQWGRTQSVCFMCLHIVSLGETSALQLFFFSKYIPQFCLKSFRLLPGVIHQKLMPGNNPRNLKQHYDHGGSLQLHIPQVKHLHSSDLNNQ